jgi:serine/threonine protein kinase
MTDRRERWRQVEQLCQAALELTGVGRAAFLRQACGEDEGLRREVEDLLAQQSGAARFLETPLEAVAASILSSSAVAVIATIRNEADQLAEGGLTLTPQIAAALVVNPLEDLAGRRIGPYEVLGEIGRGGMGAVYLAQRADHVYSKRVALKVVRPGDPAPDLQRRFQQERHIIARLDHPNIARLLDGGTTADGLAFSVMEYVEGRPIDVYCDVHHLGIRQRIALLRKVCDAVDYAHRELVVHCDIKPSNILVTADGTVKLLDFGIAKLLGTVPADSETTAASARRFTFFYASPEQIRGERVTTGSDVYSLGVVLYELLSGRRPHKTTGAVHDTVQAILQHDAAPPSNAVRSAADHSLSDIVSSSDDVATRRGTSPARLARMLDGELDNITLMALRKEPNRRYASVERLNQDLGRYLDGLPVTAQPDSGRYRARKFIARHFGQVIAASLAAAALLVAVTLTTWQASVARSEGRRAASMAAQAQAEKQRAEQQTAEANAYRIGAEQQATIAEQQARLADVRAREAEAERHRAVEAQRLAERRADSVREISRALLGLSSVAAEFTDAAAVGRRGAEAVERGLNSLRTDGSVNSTADEDAAAARAISDRLTAQQMPPPPGWFCVGDRRDFDCELERDPVRGGHVARLKSLSSRIGGAVMLLQPVDVTTYRGHRVRIGAALRSAGVDAYGAVIATPSDTADSIQARIRGDSDWQVLNVVLDVPSDSTYLSFGARLVGRGTLWADDFSIEIVSPDEPLTSPYRPTAVDLGFTVVK